MRKSLLRVKIPLWIVTYVMSAILVHYSYCRLCKATFDSKRERPISHRASCVPSPSTHPTPTPTSNPCVESRFADPLCNIVNASRSNRFYYLLLESLVIARVRPSYVHSYAEASRPVLRIRDPVPFGPLDPGSEIGLFRIPAL